MWCISGDTHFSFQSFFVPYPCTPSGWGSVPRVAIPARERHRVRPAAAPSGRHLRPPAAGPRGRERWGKKTNVKQEWLLAFGNQLQRHERFTKVLFTRTKHSVQSAVYYDKTPRAKCCLLWQNTVGKVLFTMTKHRGQSAVYYDKTPRAKCCLLWQNTACKLLFTMTLKTTTTQIWFMMMHCSLWCNAGINAGGSIAPRHGSWWCIVHYDAMQALTQVVLLLLAMVHHFMMMRGSLWCNTGINAGGSVAGRHGSLWCASLHRADHDEAVCLLHHLDLAAGGRSWHVQHGALPTTQQATGPSDQVRPVDIVGSHWFLVWSGETGGYCWISLISRLIRWDRWVLLDLTDLTSDQVRQVDVVGSHWFDLWSGEAEGCCWKETGSLDVCVFEKMQLSVCVCV